MTNLLNKILGSGLAVFLLFVAATAAQATDPVTAQDQNTAQKSGFGDTYFSDQGHPGFGDAPDAAAAAALEPAAGGEDTTGSQTSPPDSSHKAVESDTASETLHTLDVDITPDADPVRVPAPVMD